jgi:hypothetical protein
MQQQLKSPDLNSNKVETQSNSSLLKKIDYKIPLGVKRAVFLLALGCTLNSCGEKPKTPISEATHADSFELTNDSRNDKWHAYKEAKHSLNRKLDMDTFNYSEDGDIDKNKINKHMVNKVMLYFFDIGYAKAGYSDDNYKLRKQVEVWVNNGPEKLYSEIHQAESEVEDNERCN